MTRAQKITFGELRKTGVHHVLVYCRDHRCSHHIEVSAARWAGSCAAILPGGPVALVPPCLIVGFGALAGEDAPRLFDRS